MSVLYNSSVISLVLAGHGTFVVDYCLADQLVENQNQDLQIDTSGNLNPTSRSTTYIVSTEISTNLKFYISIPLSLVIVGAIAVASVTYFCCRRKNRNMKSASQRSTHGGSNSHRPLPPTPRGDHEDSENPYYTTITSSNGHAIEIPDSKPGSLELIEPGTYVTGARMVDPDIDNHRTNLSWLWNSFIMLRFSFLVVACRWVIFISKLLDCTGN